MELDAHRRKAEDDKNFYRTKNMQLKGEIEHLLKENQKLVQEKGQTHERLTSLRTLNKQQEKKLGNLSESLNQTQPDDTERRMQQSEKWVEELEEKLNFTVEKFEEQNQRFMQCGRELAEAFETIDKQESQLDTQNNQIGVMQVEINTFKSVNLGIADSSVTEADQQIVESKGKGFTGG